MFSLLLVEEDEQIVNQITEMVDTICSIVWFRNVTDAEQWMDTVPTVDLIISDRKSGHDMVVVARRNTAYQTVPILLTCRSLKPQFIKTALIDGITDIVLVDKHDYSLQSKVHYYLELKTKILSIPPKETTFSPHQFSLPWWKRAIDIAASFTILLLLSPVLLVVAALIALDSKGPILYTSKRAGTNFFVFNMYKYRTMKAQADQQLNALASQNIYAKATNELDSDEPIDRVGYLCDSCRQQGISCQKPLFDHNQLICEKVYLRENEETAKFMKFRNDPRITRLGGFLRNSSIDELPQLLNILLGDMSLVGNRPLPLYEAEKLTTDEFAQRFAGPAGLTGLWQITKRAKGQGPMSDEERTLLDIEYSRTFSFKTDMYILWRTFFSLWQKENV